MAGPVSLDLSIDSRPRADIHRRSDLQSLVRPIRTVSDMFTIFRGSRNWQRFFNVNHFRDFIVGLRESWTNKDAPSDGDDNLFSIAIVGLRSDAEFFASKSFRESRPEIS